MTRLMSFWTRPTVAAKKAVTAPTRVTTVSAVGLRSNSGDRRATMNTPAVTIVAAWMRGGHRGRTFHGVRQPSVQQELRALAHGSHEQQQADHRDGVPFTPEEVERLAFDGGDVGEDVGEADGPEHHEDAEDAQHEAEIADTIDDEGLDGRRRSRGLLVPEADQKVGGKTDALPAEEHLHKVVGRHQHQHGEGEQAEIGEEAGAVRILGHVSDRVEVDHRRNGVHHHQA